MSCPSKSTCPLFPYFQSTPLVQFWIDKYCSGDYQQCARYQKGQAGEKPELRLLPDGSSLAKDPDWEPT